MACCLLMAVLYWMNLRFEDVLLAAPIASAAKILDHLGHDSARLLLRHFAAEQSRHYYYIWEEVQFAVGIVLGIFLASGTQKRIFPITLCGLMVVITVFQHFMISPEIAFRGRSTDFPPGDSVFGEQARLWALLQVYTVAEGIKLSLGTVLASYLFVFRAHRSRREKVPMVDHANHSHVDG